MVYFPKARLREFGMEFFTRHGVPDRNAGLVVDALIDTEAMGIKTHGVLLFSYFEDRLTEGLDPKTEPVVLKENNATALIDGNGGFAQPAMKIAAELSEKKAKESGISVICVRNCLWMGALGIYLMPIAGNGFLAQLWAQISTREDCAPVGGIDAKFATNPVAFAFPTQNDPMVSDFATSALSIGKIKQMTANKQKAREPLFLDREGKRSDDPQVVMDGGSILFLGGDYLGHKGYSLSLFCEALTAVAGGDCNNPASETKQSFTLMVVDPDAFAGKDYYLKEITRFLRHVKESRLRPGFDAIRLPGERSCQNFRESELKGIPLEERIVDNLNRLAERNRIEKLNY